MSSTRPVYPSVWRPLSLFVHMEIRDGIAGCLLLSILSPLYWGVRNSLPWSERVFFAFWVCASHTGIYALFHGSIWLCELVGMLRQYKIPRKNNEVPSGSLMSKALASAVFDHMVIAPLSGIVLYDVACAFGMPSPGAPVDTHWILLALHFMAARLFQDWSYYWVHRALHSKALYARFHKQHHEFVGVVGVASEYASPFETIISNYVPALGYMLISGQHVFVLSMWIVLRLIEGYENHCGYYFQDSWAGRMGITTRQMAFHDFHHTVNMGNFGVEHVDWFFGTMDQWVKIGLEEGYIKSRKAHENDTREKERSSSSRSHLPQDLEVGIQTSWKCLAVLVVVIAVVVGVCWETTDYVRSERFTSPEQLYSASYDVTFVPAPVASGWKLSVISRLLVSSPLGDLLVRHVMRDAGVETLLELAEALQQDDGLESGREWGIGEPLVRLSSREYAWHVHAANSQQNSTMSAPPSPPPARSGARYRSVRDFHEAYKTGAAAPDKVLTKLLDFIARSDERLRCVQEVDFEGAAQAASASAARWASGAPLGVWDGVPVLIKSDVPVRGLHFTGGRRMRADRSDVPADDGIIATRLRRAGAVIVGTTVMTENGLQPTGFNPEYNGTKNPYQSHRFSGGSSGGSAVAVATGMVPVAIGFDSGGSIRIPAAWSGTVGLAPGYARVPYDDGCSNLAEVNKAGPLAGSVADAAEAHLLLAQPLSQAEGSSRHPLHALYGGDGPPPPHLKARWHGREGGVRVGVLWDWVSHRAEGEGAGHTANDDAVLTIFRKALAELSAGPLVAEVVNVSVPHMHRQALSHAFLASSFFSFQNINEGFKGTASMETPDESDDWQLASRIQLRVGRKLSAMELMAARRIRAFAISQWRKVLTSQVDVILTPTVPMTAVQRPEGSDATGVSDSSLYIQMMRYMWPANLVGLPAIAVPAGVDTLGLPVSVQAICLHWHEADCLDVGRELEAIFADQRTAPPIFVDLLGEDTPIGLD